MKHQNSPDSTSTIVTTFLKQNETHELCFRVDAARLCAVLFPPADTSPPRPVQNLKLGAPMTTADGGSSPMVKPKGDKQVEYLDLDLDPGKSTPPRKVRQLLIHFMYLN